MLLILIYRSPIFLWIPLFAVVFAEVTTRSIGYALTELGVTVNGQTSSILSILVLGAGTDYALLLVSRYREELRKHEDKHEAMALALRTAGPAIVASGATVIAALLCLTLAEVDGTAGLGPVGALGIAVAMVTMLTVLPALLVICGRRAFWRPAMFGWGNGVPHFGDEGADETHGAWRRVGERVARSPRRIWIGTASVLAHRRARPADDRHRAHAGRRLPRPGRVARGPGAAREVLPRRRERRDRGHRRAGRRRAGRRATRSQGVDGVASVQPTDLSGDSGHARQRHARARALLLRGLQPDPGPARGGQGGRRPRRRSSAARRRSSTTCASPRRATRS